MLENGKPRIRLRPATFPPPRFSHPEWKWRCSRICEYPIVDAETPEEAFAYWLKLKEQEGSW